MIETYSLKNILEAARVPANNTNIKKKISDRSTNQMTYFKQDFEKYHFKFNISPSSDIHSKLGIKDNSEIQKI